MNQKRVTIVGAGFSGLVSAFYLSRAGYELDIYESSEKSGGLISTLKKPEGLVETAANAFLNSSLVEDLFKTIGLPMIETERSARRRYIFRNGVSRRWPVGFSATLRVCGFVLRFIFNRKSLTPLEGESLRLWGHRAFGKDVTSYLLEPALQGVYAGDPSKMSARLILARLFSRSAVSQKPVLRGSVAPREGMGQLIASLEAYLVSRGVRFHFGRSFANGETAIDQATTDLAPVILATSPHAAAKLLSLLDPVKAKLLEKIELSPVITTTVFFKTTDSKSKGFGVLFPELEKRKALGILKNNFIFENRARDLFSETWIVGGALATSQAEGRALMNKSDSEIIDMISHERSIVFDLKDRPQAAYVTRWPAGIPHYTLELEKSLPTLNAPTNNIFLAGNYLGELGLAKILERASNLPDRLKKEGQWK